MIQQTNTSLICRLGESRKTMHRLQRKRLYKLRRRMTYPFKKIIDLFLANGYKLK